MVDTTILQERCDFYVYVIFRPNGEPCYVGKGQRDRWKQHIKNSHNRRLRRIIAKAQREGRDIPILKVRDCLTDAQACEIERVFISAIGRDDIGLGPLVNLTDGGEGTSGHVPTAETRERHRASLIGRKRPPEIGEAIRRAAAWERPEWRDRQRDSHLGHEASRPHKLNQCISHLRRAGRTLDDLGADGFKLTAFQRMLLNKPALTRPEVNELTRQRNMGNKWGIGNKRTPEGNAVVAATMAATNRRRNKSGNPTVWKDLETPWVDLGMSRTTWFRKRSKGM